MRIWKRPRAFRAHSTVAVLQSIRPVIEALEERRLLTLAFSGVADQSVSEGSNANLYPLAFADVGNPASHDFSVNWGDGTHVSTSLVVRRVSRTSVVAAK